MTQETVLANATLVLPGETVTGQVRLFDGQIAEIATGAAVPRGAQDCGGDVVAPGLIELHTDNLERHTGITTVFDAMRVGTVASGTAQGRERRYARQLASELLELRAAEALKISHFLHLRAEVCSETLVEEMDAFGPADRVGLVSLMDHTPGERQFRDLSKLEVYYKGKHGLSDAEFQAQVAVSHGYGIRLAEFPTTREAAAACRDSGIAVMMGAPNLIRGGSHSGNVAAAELAGAGLLDILSSDYVPAALLMGAVQLGREWGDMARGIATVTRNPAAAVGLSDRGELAPGRRADVIRFGLRGDVPAVRAVWSRGQRVA